jgi:hypothetical protein
MLLRHALLREWRKRPSIAASAPGGDLALLRDAELVDLVIGATPTRSPGSDSSISRFP